MALLGASGDPLQVIGGSTLASGSDTRFGAGSKTVDVPSVTVGTVSGGTAPYTYLWEYVSGDVFTITDDTASATTSSISITVDVGESATKTGVYKCKVTDNVSTVVYGPNCTLQATLTEIS